MVERKSFLANLKHQVHVSQYGEHDCSANNKMNGDYCGYQSLSISRMNFDYKENGGKKRFCCKSIASISCFPMERT